MSQDMTEKQFLAIWSGGLINRSEWCRRAGVNRANLTNRIAAGKPVLPAQLERLACALRAVDAASPPP